MNLFGSDHQPAIVKLAHHEAAHAVMARLSGLSVYDVTIVAGEGYRGRMRQSEEASIIRRPQSADSRCPRLTRRTVPLGERQEMISRVRTFLAGPLAGAVLTGDPVQWGTDRRGAAIAIALYDGGPWQRIRKRLKIEQAATAAVLRDHLVWRMVRAVAGGLLHCETLTGKEVDALIASANEPPFFGSFLGPFLRRVGLLHGISS